MRFYPILAVSALALAACTPATDTANNDMAADNAMTADQMATNDAVPPSAAPAPTPTDAQAFMAAAGASDAFEIKSAQMALEKSSNESVKNFAQMMITDHTKTTQGVKDAAKKAGLTAPEPAITADQQQMLDALAPLQGNAFDVQYAEQQLPAHQQALLLLTNYAANGDTPALQDAAKTAVPIVERHIATLKQMTGLDR